MVRWLIIAAFGLGIIVISIVMLTRPNEFPSMLENSSRGFVSGCYGYNGKAMLVVDSSHFTYPDQRIIESYDVVRLKTGLGFLPKRLIKAHEDVKSGLLKFAIYGDRPNFIPLESDGSFEIQSATKDGDYLRLEKLPC